MKITVSLNDEEKAKAKSAREEHERELIAIDAARKKANEAGLAEASAKRSKSFLDNGKNLLKSGNSAGAKKYFEKAIAESPESPSGQEAKKLLDKID